ncbi:hypothetical protein MSP8887_02886 [Marinomonas spartinae]|uniref:FimV N-terminal domain-containing protein n=1 Tax=Marinomonas spartinae TaxID=1792290 RepID=A0A1A8TCP1_9GAMM|nr:FimV/HubP family polar landmark protein [Marinomonas spartinae]SBS29678.1 hypothetical protein MSP8886_01573 [Marinomonas spartinae]SBS37334.1 hypothetical protein MSP8887_02886 [Marinomonas spartinae]
MLRKTLVSLAIAGAVYSVSGYALELGELTLKSSIDEPFRGQIELSDVGSLTPQDILVRLGSSGEFRQAGFSPSPELDDLSFDVARGSNGKGLIIDVVSKKVLKSKDLHFVLAARWPSGQVVREYDVPLTQSALVDKSQKEVIQSPTVTSRASKQKVATNSATNNGRSVFQKESQAANKLPVKGNAFTQAGNTLWRIAEKNRPSSKFTIYQTMIAIQALNKDAFYSNNINLLKQNVVLRIPTEQQIALFNRSMSKEEFERQVRIWQTIKSASSKHSPIAREQLNTQAKGKGASKQPISDSDRLTLASGQSALSQKNASSNEGSGNESSQLESKLSATEEMLDKEKREKQDLSNQLGDLNKQLQTLQKLISLKDQQMAELQKQLASAKQSMQEQKNTVDQLLETIQQRTDKEKAEANSWQHKIFGNPIIVSVGAVVLLMLGFLIGLLMRRMGKKKPDKTKNDGDEFDLAAATPLAATAGAAAATGAAVAAVATEEAKPEEEIEEEDPFAFDFGESEEGEDEFSEFDNLEEPAQPEDETAEESFELPDDLAFADESVVDEEEDDDPFASLDSQMDDLNELDELDGATEEFDSLDDELEAIPEDETAEEDTPEEDIPTVEPVDEEVVDEEARAEQPSDSEADFSEEESFVSNLLEDSDGADEEGPDESAIFDQEPNESLASSIEDTLAEAQEDEADIEVPSFGEAEAADGEAVDDEEEEFDFFDASGDEAATKLDLARAYMDMGDDEGARVILEDVVSSGNEQQIAEAKSMIERMFPSD